MATIYRVTVTAEHDDERSYETVFEVAGPAHRVTAALPMLADVLTDAVREALVEPGPQKWVTGQGAGTYASVPVPAGGAGFGGQGGASTMQLGQGGVTMVAGGGQGSMPGVEPPPVTTKRKRRTKAEIAADEAAGAARLNGAQAPDAVNPEGHPGGDSEQAPAPVAEAPPVAPAVPYNPFG